MSVKMQIDKDGNLVFQDTKVKLGELIRYNGKDLVDGYDNVVNMTELLGDIFENEDTQIVERALLADDTLKVGGTLAADVLTKLNYREVIPVTDIPVVTIDSSVINDDTLTGTIDNYDPENVYIIDVTLGNISMSDGVLTYNTPEIEEDTIVTISIVSIEEGTIRSDRLSIDITVYYSSTTSDQALVNAGYNSNENYNDGFEY